VFVVGLNEQLLGAAVRLEAALHELAQNYYHTHIKNVRAQKVNILPERVRYVGTYWKKPTLMAASLHLASSRVSNPDWSGFGFRIRIQEGKNDPQKVKKFHVLKCWIFFFES
jgi:hypothetical protein